MKKEMMRRGCREEKDSVAQQCSRLTENGENVSELEGRKKGEMSTRRDKVWSVE